MYKKQSLSLGLCALLLALINGNSFAQGGGFAAQLSAKKAAEADSIARLDSIARADSLRMAELEAQEANRQAEQDSIAKAELAKQDSIAKAEQEELAKKELARQDSIIKASLATKAAPPPPLYPSYEIYLDSIESYAYKLLPAIEKLDSMKLAAAGDTLKPKSEYETQEAYDKRAKNFDKDKEQKILNLQKEYQTREKANIDKFMSAVTLKTDIQPEWKGMLQRSENLEDYAERIKTFQSKTNDMRIRILSMDRLFAKLALSKSDSSKVAKTMKEKNFLYNARLERAETLMRDYVLQDQAKIRSTERTKVNMSLGAYDLNKQEFELNMNDNTSRTVPFDYTGTIKIPSLQAQEIDRKTDDFTVSIDYINFPLIIEGEKVYPGAKKAYVFYKDKEFPNTGVFNIVPGFDKLDNFTEWALRADALISGRLKPEKLDSTYAMKKVPFKEVKEKDDKPSWWTGKRIFRVLALTASAAAIGVSAVKQNSDAKKQWKTADEAFNKAEDVLLGKAEGDYGKLRNDYYAEKNKLHDIEMVRGGLYIGAGVFGAAGLLTFVF